ncbi:hypothetical protein C8Q77DRAFT_118521 [Trametes polyzona]|nr:hypothetical protein C8Q77DRAFT_118521 [Trametes polyzona]
MKSSNAISLSPFCPGSPPPRRLAPTTRSHALQPLPPSRHQTPPLLTLARPAAMTTAFTPFHTSRMLLSSLVDGLRAENEANYISHAPSVPHPAIEMGSIQTHAVMRPRDVICLSVFRHMGPAILPGRPPPPAAMPICNSEWTTAAARIAPPVTSVRPRSPLTPDASPPERPARESRAPRERAGAYPPAHGVLRLARPLPHPFTAHLHPERVRALRIRSSVRTGTSSSCCCSGGFFPRRLGPSLAIDPRRALEAESSSWPLNTDDPEKFEPAREPELKSGFEFAVARLAALALILYQVQH